MSGGDLVLMPRDRSHVGLALVLLLALVLWLCFGVYVGWVVSR